MSETKRPEPQPPSPAPSPRSVKDIAILSGPTADGQGARVVRIRESGEVSTGELRPLREGEPLNQSEIVRLHPLDPSKRVCEIEVLHGAPTEPRPRETTPGPARVSNAKYRQNWSEIFDPKPPTDWTLN
jgi:hypothetical protein